MSVGTPLNGEIVAHSANRMRARGTLNFANSTPVVTAESEMPTMTSAVTSVSAAAARMHHPVADRAHRLDAEEEMVGDGAGHRAVYAADHGVQDREHEIDEEEQDADAGEVEPPRRTQDPMVEVTERRTASADDLDIALESGLRPAMRMLMPSPGAPMPAHGVRSRWS